MLLQIVGVIGLMSAQCAALFIFYKKLINKLAEHTAGISGQVEEHSKLAATKVVSAASAASVAPGYAVCDKCSLTVARYNVKEGKTICQNCSGE